MMRIKLHCRKYFCIINDLGYDVKFEANTQKDIVLLAVKELVVILAVFLLLQHSGILNRLAPDSLADASMSYGMLFCDRVDYFGALYCDVRWD